MGRPTVALPPPLVHVGGTFFRSDGGPSGKYRSGRIEVECLRRPESCQGGSSGSTPGDPSAGARDVVPPPGLGPTLVSGPFLYLVDGLV